MTPRHVITATAILAATTLSAAAQGLEGDALEGGRLKGAAGRTHRIVETGFWMTEGFHRADVAHVGGSVFAIGAVVFDRLPTAMDAGQGWHYLYDWRDDRLYGVGSFGDGVQSVRVAGGCECDDKGGPAAAGLAWFAWDTADGVSINRRSSNGSWAGSTTFIEHAHNPSLAAGWSEGESKVILLYEIDRGARSYLYYRFLGCDGGVGPAYAIRSVGEPWHFWHAEAAFNPFDDRWRVFWDERNRDTLETHMRTKYVRWNGHHSGSTYLLTCQNGGPSKAFEPLGAIDGSELIAEETEWQDVDETVGRPGDAPLKYHYEGCKRFFASFDPDRLNSTHRYLLSSYGKTLTLVSDGGGVVDTETGHYSIPVTGLCTTSWCSYREIGDGFRDDATHARLTDVSFTDQFNFGCSGGDPEPITPSVKLPYPVAMTSGDGVSVVLYRELVSSATSMGYLYLTVIED